MADVEARQRLAEADERLELAHGDAVRGGGPGGGVVAAQALVARHELALRRRREARLDGARVLDVALHLVHGVGRVERGGGALVHLEDVGRDGGVVGGVGLVDHHVQQVEAREDGGREGDVVLQRLGAVVPPRHRVGGRQDGRPRVERGLDARLGDGDGLLLHGLVDCDLVLDVHLVKLVDAADAVVRQHQRARLDAKLVALALLAAGAAGGGAEAGAAAGGGQVSRAQRRRRRLASPSGSPATGLPAAASQPVSPPAGAARGSTRIINAQPPPPSSSQAAAGPPATNHPPAPPQRAP